MQMKRKQESVIWEDATDPILKFAQEKKMWDDVNVILVKSMQENKQLGGSADDSILCRFESLKQATLLLQTENAELRNKQYQLHPTLLRKLPRTIFQMVMQFLDCRRLDTLYIRLSNLTLACIHHKEDNMISIYNLWDIFFQKRWYLCTPIISRCSKQHFLNIVDRVSLRHSVSWSSQDGPCIECEQLGSKRIDKEDKVQMAKKLEQRQQASQLELNCFMDLCSRLK